MESHPDPRRKYMLSLAAIIITIAFACVKIRYFLTRRRFALRHGCRPLTRRANKDPFFGLDGLVRVLRAATQHKALAKGWEAYRRYQYTFASKLLLTRSIFTIEPENIKTILSINFKHYGIGYRQDKFGPLLGKGIFDTDGDHWSTSRALIRPNFTRDQVADLASFEDLMPDLLALIPRDGETVIDLQDLFFRYTIDSATEFLFGQSVGSLRMSDSELGFASAFNYAQKAITLQSILGPFGILYPDAKADECNRFCRRFAQQFVDEAVLAAQSGPEKAPQATQRQKYIFSHELAKGTSDKNRVLDELLNVLLAGRDTTASLLSNMFFMLAKHPRVWAKLRAEVMGLEGQLPTYEELQNLKYLKCCMNESLRLHPVVPMNEREALQDTVLPVGGGQDGLSPVFVPKGTFVGYSVYALHRRPDIYGPDAEEFRPERWEDGKLLPRWGYLPFNGGPRICIGQRYALTEVGYVTVRLAQEFHTLRSRDSGPWEEGLTLTLCSHNGTKVSVTPA